MQRAVEAFESDFARWDLHLPAEALESRQAGQIRHAGWSIRYNFGRDDAGEYLDYYASPRDVREDAPGDDWHVRLYDSGERMVLPPVLEAYMYGRDPTWEELERARRQHVATTNASQTNVSPAEGVSPDLAVEDAETGGSSEPEASTDTEASYLPLDIGLPVEMELADGSAAGDSMPASLTSHASSPADAAPVDLFYAPEDLSQFLPAAPPDPAEEHDEGKPDREEEQGEQEEEPAPPSAFFLAVQDEIPAPITLEVPVIEATPQPGDIVPEEDEPQAEARSEAEMDSVESIGAVPLAEPDSLSHVSLESEADEEASSGSASHAPRDQAGNRPPTSPPLAGKAIPTKIFRRADLVRTADVGSIDLHVDPKVFQPWWFRPNARRAALAIAAVLVIAIVAVARAHHRAKLAAQDLGPDIDTSAMNASPVPVASPTTADSSGTTDTTASPDSQPAATTDSATNVSAPAPDPAAETRPKLPPPSLDPGEHNADGGMAKPAGPRSLSPIVPAGKGAAAAPTSKYPSGNFPRGYSP